jgi:hypothetical protein
MLRIPHFTAMNSLTRLIALVSALLVGCVIAPREVNLYEGNDAIEIRHRKYDEGLTVWDRVEVWAVNEKFIGATYVGATTRLAPGRQKLVIHMYFRRGLGPVYEGFATLMANLTPSARLTLNGKTDGTEIVVWLEDVSNGATVSETSRGTWRVMPESPTPIPIFIPAKR